MSAYPPPNEVLPIFNPTNYANVGNTGTEDIPFLSTYFLRFPTSQGSETIDGTLVGKEQITAEKNIVMSGTAGVNFLEFPDGTQQFTATGGGSILTSNNVFTGTNEFQNTLTGTTNVIMSGTAGTNFLEFPDGTKQFTASAGGNPTNILSSNNTWTGNQNWNGVNSLTTGATTLAPADGDNGTAVPTTAWVNTAIKDALSNIQPSTNNSVNQIFTGAVISTTYSIPADADNFSIGLLGVGGYAGASATSVPISPGNTTDFTLYSGGQGGGSIGNQISTLSNTGVSGIGLAGQLLTLSCSGHGTGTSVQLSWTNSITGLPVVISVPNGGDGGNATSSSAGTGGAGALVSASVLPALGPAWLPKNSPQAPSGSPGASFAFNSSTPLTAVPYAGLTPAYSSTQVAGSAYDEQFLPFEGTGSGSQGYGQIYQSFFTSADTIYRNSNATFFGYGVSPIGTGYINVSWTVGDPKQLGGTNSSFIAYDNPDPLVKTKQIYTDKEGLVVSQDLTGSYKTTTLTPTNLTQDLNGVVSTALISDIITSANTDDTLQEVLNAGNTAINADLILTTSANDNQIKLNGTSTNGIQITNPTTGTYPYATMGISGFSQGANATNTLQASNNLVRVLNNSLGNPAETSIRSGVSSLNESNITAQSNSVGYTTTPTIQVFNTNTTAGNTTGVPSVEYYKSGRNAVAGDLISTHSFNAKNYVGTKTEFARIEAGVRSTGLNNDDGSIGFYCATQSGGVNVLGEFFRLNGADNENNSFRPLDMNGNALKTSTGSLSIETTASSGTGTIALTPKTGAVVDIQGDATLTGTRQTTFGGGTAITNIINRTGLLINNATTQSIYQDANCNLVETDTPNNSQYFNTNLPQSQTIKRLEISSGNDIQKNQSTLVQTRLDYTDTPTGDTSSIRLENDLASKNNIIGANFTTGAGAVLETIIQTTPYGQHRLSMTNNNTGFATTLSTTQLQINDTTNNKSITIDNNSSGQSRIDLFENDGGGISSTTGAVNTTSTQTLFLNHADNANTKSITIENNRSVASAISFNNTIDGNPFNITTNTDLNISSTKAGGSTQLSSLNGVEIVGDNSVVLNASNNTGGTVELKVNDSSGVLKLSGTALLTTTGGSTSSQHLAITINNTQYRIALLE